MGTKIEWAGEVWNPVTGCSPVSEGCENCYARRFAERLRKNPRTDKYRNGFQVTWHESELEKPFSWKKPRRVFVCSMGDLFHPDVPNEYIFDVFAIISKNEKHQFIVLTKRPERMLVFSNYIGFYRYVNLWVGISAENQKHFETRMITFSQIQAPVRFVSFEPLLGPINLKPYAPYIDWAIVGGETGPGARRMEPNWALSLLSQCKSFPIPFFFKQMGPHQYSKGRYVRELDGRKWEEWPDVV